MSSHPTYGKPLSNEYLLREATSDESGETSDDEESVSEAARREVGKLIPKARQVLDEYQRRTSQEPET